VSFYCTVCVLSCLIVANKKTSHSGISSPDEFLVHLGPTSTSSSASNQSRDFVHDCIRHSSKQVSIAIAIASQ